MMLATRSTRWDPFQDLRNAQDERTRYQMDSLMGSLMDSLFPSTFSLYGLYGQRQSAAVTSPPVWAPALDIAERKDAYLVSVELPGVKLDDLKITLDDGLLTIQGERSFTDDTSKQQYHRVERFYGAFRRSITLPAHVMAEGVEASIEDGVLQILVPKAEQAKPKRIEVRPAPGREAIEAIEAIEATSPTS
jgi:HSP20 family protein